METTTHAGSDRIAGRYAGRSFPLHSAADLDPLMDRIGDAHFVLLGEASHGTHEYYAWRAAISRRLLEEKDFRFIAVEGDWPDCYRINRFIKGDTDQDKEAVELLKSFNRWPTWMWANWEIAALVNWLREHNEGLPRDKKVGFYGLDVYSLWESMGALMEYLEKTDPMTARLARNAIHCFEPYREDGRQYAESQFMVPDSCREEVIRLLTEIRSRAPSYDHDPEASLNMEQNAQIAVQAEAYYRSMISFNNDSWNIRDLHMVDTLNRLMRFYGEDAKGIVWEHNTHIGDARFTDMSEAGMVNVGQLVREQNADKDVVLAGFSSYRGSVVAGKAWDAPMEKMEVPPGRPGSAEQLLHEASAEDKLLIFDRPPGRERVKIPHRAIGVVYDPKRERYGNYVPTVLNARYDALLFVDETHALHPLHYQPDGHETPETYPFNY